MSSWVGFRRDVVEYDRAARSAGETKYPIRRMLRFALDGVTSFSNFPLQLAALAGVLCALVALLGLPLTIVARYSGIYERGVPSLLFVILLIGGIQLLALGRDRRVPRAHLRRGQAAAALRRLTRAQPRCRGRRRGGAGRRRAPRRGMRVAVIGAGVAGLVCAHRLAQEGHAADVYERWPGLGGQAATIDVGGHLLERYYHHLFTSDRHIAELYEELGMPDELEWRPSSMAFFLEGRSWPFTSPLHLLRFKPLSLPARVRMGLAVLKLQKTARSVEPFESITAREWIRSAMGAQPYEKIWGPLLRGKFGDRADDISMAWLWGKLTMRRKLEGKEARQELLGYPRRSWEPLFHALQASIETRGGRVLIDRPAQRIARIPTGFEVTAGAAGSFRRGHDPAAFEPAGAGDLRRRRRHRPQRRLRRRCSTTTLTRAIGPEYLGRLERIEYHTALCLLLELDRQFSPYYWTNVADPELPFVGLVEHTNFVEPERYDGRRFLYVANYLAPGDELLEPRRRRAARALHAGPAQGQPGLRALMGQGALAAPRAGRAADRHRRLPGADPAAADGRRAPRARQHDADLPRGPRDQLRRAAGRRRRRRAALAALEQRLGRDRVVAPVAPRVAAQQPPAREHEAAPRAVVAHGLDRVVRARRQVLAAARQQRRDEALVEADRREQDGAHGAHAFAPPSPATSSESAPRMPAVPSRSASSRASGRATTT